MSDAEALARTYREEDKRQMRQDVRDILATPQGRRALMGIIGLGGVYAPLGREADRYDSGRRDAAAELLTFCNQVAREHVQQAAQERTQLCSQREASIQTIRKDDKHE